MTPILTGIVASGISGHLTPPWSPEGAYDSLATVTVPAGGLASVTFAGIPTGYKHLQIRSVLVNTAGASGNYAALNFNNDSSSVYSWHLISGNGSTVSTNNLISTSAIRFDQGLYSSNSNTSPQSTIMDIIDYSSALKNTTTRALDVGDANGAGFASIISGAYYNLNPITQIKLSSFSTGSPSTFGEHSRIALYGVK